MAVYHNSDVIVQSWYPLIPSKKLGKKKVRSYFLNDLKIAIYRGEDGKVRALDSRCPHMGTDMSGGKVVDNDLQCPFHHWEFNEKGRCSKIPGDITIPDFANTFSFPVEEKYGYVWVFIGKDPLFPIPVIDGYEESDFEIHIFQERLLKCHPHLITYNCLDMTHWKTVHGLSFNSKPSVIENQGIGFIGTFDFLMVGNKFVRKILQPFYGKSVEMTCKTYGGNLVVTESFIKKKLSVVILFSNTIKENGCTDEILFFMLPKYKTFRFLSFLKRLLFPLVVYTRYLINVRDIPLLENMKHWVNLSESDSMLEKYINQINKMKTFN